MATKRREIARLLKQGFSQNEVCSALRCSKRDVSAMAKLLEEATLSDEALAGLSEADLRQLAKKSEERESDYIQPDWDHLAQEITRPGVTHKLLWHEYGNTSVPEGKKLYQYSRFSELLSTNAAISSATARIAHKPGRTVFVDWAGGTLAIKDRVTGREVTVYLFVACLPYSDYFYVEGFLDMTQRCWITGHIHAFEYFGGVPVVVTPDRCATAVDRTPIYTTKINEAYNDFIEYHGAAVLPARGAHPRDKSGVESAVGLCERWVVAPLRDEVFFSLGELNEVVSGINDRLNAQPFQVKEGSRESVFYSEEKPLLNPLPAERYEMFEWKKAKLSHDYHFQVDYMRYSADYRLIGQELSVRVSDTRVTAYHKGEPVATHKRLYGRKGQYETEEGHMPPNHRYANSSWSPERFSDWAASVGPKTKELIEALMASRPIIEQSFVACANILGLARKGRRDLLEAACGRIAETGLSAISYTRVKNTLEAVASIKRLADAEASCALEDVEDSAPDIGRTRDASYYRRGGRDAT